MTGVNSATPPRRRRLARVSAGLNRPDEQSDPSRISKVGNTIGKAVTWDGWLKLGAVVTAVGVLVGFWFTDHSLQATNRQIEASNRQLVLAQQTEITDRLAKAVEELDNQGLDARMGGIYLLGQLAHDSIENRSVAFEIIGAYVRTHAAYPAEVPRQMDSYKCNSDGKITPDIQAALTVIGHRDSPAEEPVDLSETCLNYAQLMNLDFRNVDLTRSGLMNAEIKASTFVGSRFQDVSFVGARTTDTDFRNACFAGTILTYTSLTGDDLRGATFDGGYLKRTGLTNVKVGSTTLHAMDIRQTDLTGLDMSQVTVQDLFANDENHWPPGFTPPPLTDRAGIAPGCQ
ncbi:pentapeptide repeat-containing protein [Nocardia sp. CDC160]|uniref:pentapeptide repeat-containing protein n=1 Tax=Nocardia sp. CDC160 TaxID=3112166 RepID=UPI002DBE1517|nr:pentapeptide repeat-containing protein [Nocardia sp. CDC160]MEC3914594.1 pentapeptide repeat-containing protein [Nocardia sp. CDC160]